MRALFLFVCLASSFLFGQKHTTVILTRHGDTYWNEGGRLQGTVNTHLTMKGVREAMEKAVLYKDEPVAAVYSSPRTRAHLTAEIIATAHNLGVTVKYGLAEPWYGPLEGMKISKIKKEIDPRLNAMSRSERLNSGQLVGLMSPKMVADRVQGVLIEVAKEHPGRTVIAVSHSGIIEALLAVCTSAICESITMSNMAFLKFVFDGKELRLAQVSPDIAYKTY